MLEKSIRILSPFILLGLSLGSLSGCQMSLRSRANDPPPPPPAPAPAPVPTINKPKFGGFKFKVSPQGVVELPGAITFETGTANLKPESASVLQLVQQYLEAKPQVTKLRIEGHTDSEGQLEDNQVLSEQRSLSVSRWLVSKGIDCKRLVPVGFGESQLLVSPETNEDDMAKNRRVVFVKAEENGAALDGLPLDGGGSMTAGGACE